MEDFQVVRVDNSSPRSIDIDALLEPEPEECKSYFCCYAVKMTKIDLENGFTKIRYDNLLSLFFSINDPNLESGRSIW